MNKQDLAALLDECSIAWQEWGKKSDEKSFDTFYESQRHGEITISIIAHPDISGALAILHKKRAAIIRIYYDSVAVGKRLTLVEYKEGEIAQGKRVFYPRLTNNGSLSETMWPNEIYEDSVLRGFHEELGLLRLTQSELLSWHFSYLVLPPAQLRPSKKYPGTFSLVEIEYGSCVLPSESDYFFVQYIERNKEERITSIFRWWDMVSPLSPIAFANDDELLQYALLR